MHCTNCGNNISDSDKFCKSCGKELNPKQSVAHNPNFNLLDGINTPNKDLQSFYRDYANRYHDEDFVSDAMPKETRNYIFNKKYKQLIKTPLDEIKISKLSKDKLNLFIEKSIPIIDGLITDMIVIGYLIRQNCDHLNEHSTFSEFSDIKDIEGAANYLTSVDTPEMHEFSVSDTGFKIHPTLTGVAGPSPIETVEKNLHKFYPPSKLLTEAAIILYLNLGWHLARFDIGRTR